MITITSDQEVVPVVAARGRRQHVLSRGEVIAAILYLFMCGVLGVALGAVWETAEACQTEIGSHFTDAAAYSCAVLPK